jgi:hypothetical protein
LLATSYTHNFTDLLFSEVVSEQGSLCCLANALEPMVSLSVPRVVDPKQAEIFNISKLKDVEFIKTLFKQGNTSPNDIHGISGASLFYVGIPYHKIQCKKDEIFPREAEFDHHTHALFSTQS